MSDYLALLIVVGIIAGAWWLSRLRVWRTCRCGAQYCNTCNARKGK